MLGNPHPPDHLSHRRARLGLPQRVRNLLLSIPALLHGLLLLAGGHNAGKLSLKPEEENGGTSPEFSLVLLGEAAAYPHGSRKPQRVCESEVVLMDCGCTVQGYQSDVSRTFVLGKAPDNVRKVWYTVHEGQQIAFRTARVGIPAGQVDDTVRAFYAKQGFGPRYQLPGLSHRTGHGIGLDGHEPVNFVHNETTTLRPGMCFSDEPGLYLPGKFGVRLEDCFHMTESGPAWFSIPPVSLEKPV
ncbi:M24 family metallopeptidase [Sphingosinicellaceae bacterium]|nr:M24 family metallopeptidase [Sphingosinicellaceae bacterium]